MTYRPVSHRVGVNGRSACGASTRVPLLDGETFERSGNICARCALHHHRLALAVINERKPPTSPLRKRPYQPYGREMTEEQRQAIIERRRALEARRAEAKATGADGRLGRVPGPDHPWRKRWIR